MSKNETRIRDLFNFSLMTFVYFVSTSLTHTRLKTLFSLFFSSKNTNPENTHSILGVIMGTNMLSVKKIKLHGMQDQRWTVHDHKTQYRGLVRLFERDRKINDGDLKMSLKKNKKELKHLFKHTITKRQMLDNCVDGDRNLVNNLLATDRNLKLAYKNVPVEEILDHLFQNNFSKRKTMDLLKYRLKIKTEHLIKLRLEEDDVVTQIQLGMNRNKTPLEMHIGVTTGKVQDMILKKEAAITVNATYKVLLDLLSKDAIYYNAVLDALSKDNNSQGHCLLQAISLGQLATEHLDDMRVEYEHLQTVVKADRKIRVADIEEVEHRLNDTVKNLRTLVRKDSDLNMGFVSNIEISNSFKRLEINIDSLEEDIKKLQRAIGVSSFDDIFPCLTEQARQSKRLYTFLWTSLENREVLIKKTAHATLMVETIENSSFSQESKYDIKKEELLGEINEMKKRFEETVEERVRLGSVMTQIRASLQNLESLLKMVRGADRDESDFNVLKDNSHDTMKCVIQKIAQLTSNRAMEGLSVAQVVTPDKYEMFNETIKKAPVDIVTHWKEEPDDSEMIMDDSSIPTRADIKEASRVIYENFLSSQIV